jgi:hypothetical protein
MKDNLPQVRISKRADELLEKFLDQYEKENGLRQTKTWFVTNCVLNGLKTESQINAGDNESDLRL